MSPALGAAIDRLARLETGRDRRLAWSLLVSVAYLAGWAVLRFT